MTLLLASCGGIEVELRIAECSNPDLLIEEQLWETEETIPDSWRGRQSVSGTFRIAADGQTGTFVGPDGVSMTYRIDTETLRAHPCYLQSPARLALRTV